MTQNASARDPRYAAPAAPVEDVDTAAQGVALAGRGQRFWAALVDMAVALAGAWVLSQVTPWDPWTDPDRGWWQPDLLNTGVGFCVFLALQGWLLAHRGQTVGKAALGIRITRPDGGAVPLGRLIGLRYGVGFAAMVMMGVGALFALVDALLIFRRSRRCLHDVIADTIVVRT